jgi:hypothetical protein
MGINMAAIATLMNFDFANGEHPTGSLVEDAAGDLFGTAVGLQTEQIFEIAKTRDGYASAPTILATFDDTSFDASGLTIDAAGDLFAQTHGASVYEIAKTANGYAAPALLGNVGGEPAGSLVIADSGDLIGVTAPYVSGHDINVYELGTGGASAATILASIALPGDESLSSESALQVARDSAGDLFIAFGYGPFIGGTVLVDEIAKTPTGYAAPQTLGSFGATYAQLNGLLVDAAGNVFAGVSGYGSAIVEIAKTDDGYATNPTYVDANLPAGLTESLVKGSDGNLFAATAYDIYGGGGFGQVFMETPSSGGGYSRETIAQFDEALGQYPNGLLLGPGGELYGTTPGQSTLSGGTLFRIDLQPLPIVSITFVDSAPGVFSITGKIDAADAALPVSIYDGDDFLGTLTPAADGFWAFTAFLTVPSGESDFEAVATNASGGVGSAKAVQYYNTNNNWAVNSGADGEVFLRNAQASITAGGASVFFNGPDNSVSLYNTSGDWDAVTGDYGVVILTSSQASIFGGGDVIYFASPSENAVSLYSTFDAWDKAVGDNASLTLVDAQVSVFGGYDKVYLNGSVDDAASLYATNGRWDRVDGDDGLITLNNAEASVIGEGDHIYFAPGTNDKVTLYNTHNVADSVSGSDGLIIFSNAQSSVSGGSNDLVFDGQDDAADLYATTSGWDNVSATGGSVTLHGAQTNVFGGGNTIHFDGSDADAASLYQTGGNWDTVFGDDGAVTLNGARASLVGHGDYVYFNSDAYNGISLYGTYGVDDHIVGSHGAINLTSAQADVQGDGNQLYLSGASTAAMTGSDENFFFRAAIGQATIGGFVASDIIQFSSADFADWQALSGHITQSGDDAVITYDANDKVTLTDTSASSLTAANFKFA